MTASYYPAGSDPGAWMGSYYPVQGSKITIETLMQEIKATKTAR